MLTFAGRTLLNKTQVDDSYRAIAKPLIIPVGTKCIVSHRYP